MRALGRAKLHVKPTRSASNVVGALLPGHCPGTGAAALGLGNYDAIAGIAGLMVGSYVHAETSDDPERDHTETAIAAASCP